MGTACPQRGVRGGYSPARGGSGGSPPEVGYGCPPRLVLTVFGVPFWSFLVDFQRKSGKMAQNGPKTVKTGSRGTLVARRDPLGHLTRGKVSPEAELTRRVRGEPILLRIALIHPDALYMPPPYHPGYTPTTLGTPTHHAANDPSSMPPADGAHS